MTSAHCSLPNRLHDWTKKLGQYIKKYVTKGNANSTNFDVQVLRLQKLINILNFNNDP
jgi:hypothetical protein